MPTYTYKCDDCGHGFEAVQRFADDPLTECPQCGSAIRRVIQPVGVVFKGSGWYITDSRPKSSSDSDGKSSAAKPAEKTEKAASAAKADSGKADSGKADSGKSAEKSVAKVAD